MWVPKVDEKGRGDVTTDWTREKVTGSVQRLRTRVVYQRVVYQRDSNYKGGSTEETNNNYLGFEWFLGRKALTMARASGLVKDSTGSQVTAS